jgi:hypothetical protein
VIARASVRKPIAEVPKESCRRAAYPYAVCRAAVRPLSCPGPETRNLVTQIVITPPDRSRPDATASDYSTSLSCRNATSSDRIRRIPHAWHAEGGGLDWLSPRGSGLRRAIGITGHYTAISHHVMAVREGAGLDRGKRNDPGRTKVRRSDRGSRRHREDGIRYGQQARRGGKATAGQDAVARDYLRSRRSELRHPRAAWSCSSGRELGRRRPGRR